jgi:hypothetical protein
LNLLLQKEIVLHIFRSLGVFESDVFSRPSFHDLVLQEKYLLNKKLAFETEDKEKHKKDIWAVNSRIDNANIKLMVADLSDGAAEYALIIQLDNFPPYGLRLSANEDDYGTISVNVGEGDWAPADVMVQSKLLSGFESLALIFREWNKLEDFSMLYKKLILFLNSQEEIEA